MSFDERVVLILALIPHIRPQTLDMHIIHNKTFDRGCAEFGGRHLVQSAAQPVRQPPICPLCATPDGTGPRTRSRSAPGGGRGHRLTGPHLCGGKRGLQPGREDPGLGQCGPDHHPVAFSRAEAAVNASPSPATLIMC